MGYLIFFAVILIMICWAYTLSKETVGLFKRARKILIKGKIDTTPELKEPIKAIIAHPDSPRFGGFLTSKQETLESYRVLLSKIVGQGDNARAVDLIDSIKWPRGEDRHYVFLTRLANLIKDEISIHFFFAMDWKASVRDLTWHIEGALKDSKRPKPFLPSLSKYPDNASVQHGIKGISQGVYPESGTSPVFEDYIRALNKVGLGLGFLETLSDSFLTFLYDLEDGDEVRHAVVRTGAGPGHGFIG